MKLESESKTFKSTVQQLFLIFLIQQSYPFTFTSNSLDVDCSCELAITLFPPLSLLLYLRGWEQPLS